MKRSFALKNCARHINLRSLSTSVPRHGPQVCVIGSGPAGFYVTQHIIKTLPDAKVDIYEKLPVPFGLVRFGVAPDHPEVKNVINSFTKTAQNPRVRFVGNVSLGKDMSLKDLQELYHAVVLTYGAAQDKTFGIPGEDLENILSARRFVGWYNGQPGDEKLNPDLSVDTVAVLGQGNVALDVARVLLAPIDQLKSFDITQHALEALSESRVKRVLLIGRRGPLQAAFTIKEAREMVKLENCKTVFRLEDFKGVKEFMPNVSRPRKRLIELLTQTAMEPKLELVEAWKKAERSFEPIFYRNPVAFLPSVSTPGKVGAVKLAVTKLNGEMSETQSVINTNEFEELKCGLALRSIGYKAFAADPDIPFDPKQGIIKNSQGRVEGLPGVYCGGWVGTGPVGVIVNTMGNAFELGRVIEGDIKDGTLNSNIRKPGFEEAAKILDNKGVQVVSFKDWEKIDSEEQNRGP
ncbi:NADPH:adrenodoxin oxidoreductase, mitochondrial isoform X2 [Neocloeon triangulifer]|uniref:NADPH:adrenodoxin oxidoreductase, mitochondrial isoform X2 n=1 Tax=Neocloeon triangulifer TaxID=2078957 RepID=UPI00286EBC58|nr:NADPH:adrenodoxin oxidoreductase, mitochondrial isoform X2 [Neocloeon triangulifer]